MPFVCNQQFCQCFNMLQNTYFHRPINFWIYIRTIVHNLKKHSRQNNTKGGKKYHLDSVSRSEIIKLLYQSVLYEDDHFVAFNKPNGLCTFNQDGMSRNSYPIKYSGVMVLSKSPEASRSMTKLIETCRSHKTHPMMFLCVVQGTVNGGEDIIETVTCERIQIDGTVQTVPAVNVSTTRRKKGEIISAEVTCRTLSINRHLDCSLIQIQSAKDKWDLLEWYCTQKLCRVIGDTTYSGRVTAISGVPSHIEPHAASRSTSNPPEKILSQLEISTDMSHLLPVCVHRYRVPLTTPPSPRTVRYVTAPLPAYFTTLLDKLSLSLPRDDDIFS